VGLPSDLGYAFAIFSENIEAYIDGCTCHINQDVAKFLPVTNPNCLKAQTVAMEIVNTFKPDDLATVTACRRIAEKVLGAYWTHKDIYDPKSDWNFEGDSEGAPVFAIGHCHIDVNCVFRGIQAIHRF
jgi:alpha-mannosidase